MDSMEKRIPRHVSIIMDGSGRWAKARGKERIQGHVEGIESVRAVVEAAAEEGVEYISLYAFSEENWNRPQKEVSFLMDLMVSSIEKEIGAFIEKGVKCVVLGNRARLGEKVDSALKDMERRTAGGKRITLIVFLSYSGKWDILQAARKLAMKYASDPSALDNVQAGEFGDLLVTAGVPDPDLIIRTSGEQRISNYLLWQAAYSELLFVDTLWPDFGKDEFRAAISEYSKRNRRYGKVK